MGGAPEPPRLEVAGLGGSLPETVLTSEALETRLGLSPGWILRRTGIVRRHILDDGEALLPLALAAARRAFDDGALEPARADALIVCSSCPETSLPPQASQLAALLGCDPCLTFDLNASSASFLGALAVAEGLLAAGRCEQILVVAAEALSRQVDWSDPQTCILFGDGCAAALLRREREGDGAGLRLLLREISWGSDGGLRGQHSDALSVAASSAGQPRPPLTMDGRRVFLAAVRRLAEALESVCGAAGVAPEALGRVVPHQANGRLLEALAQRSGLPESLFFRCVADVGNVGAASLPLALVRARQEEALPLGSPVALLAFGAGFSWGAALLDCDAPSRDGEP